VTLLSLLYSSRKTPLEYLTSLNKHFKCAHCRTGAPVIGFTGWGDRVVAPVCPAGELTMTGEQYWRIREAVIVAGFQSDIDWSESVQAPASAFDFWKEYAFVVCNSGMRATVAVGIRWTSCSGVRQSGACCVR
jgi:hypothetical protein